MDIKKGVAGDGYPLLFTEKVTVVLQDGRLLFYVFHGLGDRHNQKDC